MRKLSHARSRGWSCRVMPESGRDQRTYDDVAGREPVVRLPAGDRAEQHIKDTIARPVDRHLCETELPAEIVAAARAESDDGEAYCRGAVAGEYNPRTWGYLRPGDYVLFRRKGRYIYVAQVITKHQSPDFARAVGARMKRAKPGN